MKVSLIVTTYNSEEWLEKTLIGIKYQTFRDFELIIADDGSGPVTKSLIDSYVENFPIPIIHVWHEDNGFQKTRILNKAILAASGDYLIFTDGDCILRRDFVEMHIKNSALGYFLSGGYFKLPMTTSKAITSFDILSQKCFDLQWLYSNGLKKSFKNIKLLKNKHLMLLFNSITPTRATWNGHNASGWKKDLLEINGFNEEMGYGGEDREFGERLFNKGIKSKQIRYTAICVHLDHSRSYVSDSIWKKNYTIRATTKQKKIIQCPLGINLLYTGSQKNKESDNSISYNDNAPTNNLKIAE